MAQHSTGRFLFITFVAAVCVLRQVTGQGTYRSEVLTMSSQYSNWVASNAFDGNHNTDADGCQCCAATQPGTNPWLNVDLGDIYPITHVVVYGRIDAGGIDQSLNGLRVLLDGTLAGSVQYTNTDVNYYHFDFSEDPFTARNIRFVLPARNKILTLCEVDVYKGRIISINKPASLSSLDYNWEASRAVDGNFYMDAQGCQCCAATLYQSNPWFRVDLGYTHKLSRIVIYGRTEGQVEGQQFGGMTINVDGGLIKTIPNIGWRNFYDLEIRPIRTGQIITLDLVGSSKQLVVCELLVIGDCLDYHFGSNCASQCHCEGQPCNTSTGICPSGDCKPGYKGATCNQNCPDYTFGSECKLRCNCEGAPCDTVTGICPSGVCAPGYKGGACSRECEDGRYGQNCSESCGHCFDDQLCDDHTGYCGFCEPGYTYTDPLCKTVCPAYTFGSNCIGICHCQGEPCDTTTAICPSGRCQPGYTGETCSQDCEGGWYGEMCSVPCGHCVGANVCDHLTGRCEHCKDVLGQCELCDVGYTYKDPSCQTECDPGWYGQNCTVACGHCLNGATCDHITGHCKQCEPGYNNTDPLCNTECDPGWYGQNCTVACGHCLNGATCDHITGHCKQCEPGYNNTDPLCNTECDPGWYGQNCTVACGHCLNGATCDHITGHCKQCEPGYNNTDPLCNTECENGTCSTPITCGYCRDNENCSTPDGYCTECMDGYTLLDRTCRTQCDPGWYGQNCTVACGHCLNGTTCDHITGHCKQCEPGYNNTDPLCNTGFNCEYSCGSCSKDDYLNKTRCPRECCDKQLDLSNQSVRVSGVNILAFASSVSAVIILRIMSNSISLI